MHPIELLRAVARAGRWEDAELASEAAWGLGELGAADPQALLPACRRLVEGQPGCGPLWWVCARVLGAPDPVDEAYRCAHDLEHDPTPRVVRNALAGVGRAVRHGGVGNLASADVAVVEASALGTGPDAGMVVDSDAASMLVAARDLGVTVWVQSGVGRILPPRLWAALKAGVEGPHRGSRHPLAGRVFESLDGVDRVVGPDGPRAVADLAPADCPELPEIGGLDGPAPDPGRGGLPAVASAAMPANVEFPSNGGTAQGYLAEPAGGGPGVVVIQEWWGLVPHIESVCDRFALDGFVALAPDLYHGASTTEPDEAGKAMMAMSMEQSAKDMSGAVDEVARRATGAGVGVIGFCMGGGLALVLACLRPDAVTACVPFYGIVPWPDAQPDYAAMNAAVLGHYASKDTFFTPEAARALGEQLRGLGKEAEIHVYEGADHAFFNDTRPEVYDTGASELAWRRTVEFLHRHLG